MKISEKSHMVNKMHIIFFLVLLLGFSSCITERFILKSSESSDMPDRTKSIAVLCYSEEDELSKIMTEATIEAFRRDGYNVLSYQSIKKNIPAYPEELFMDTPVYVKKMTRNVSLSEDNKKVLMNAVRNCGSEYVLFIDFRWKYFIDLNFFGIPRGTVDYLSESMMIDVKSGEELYYFKWGYGNSRMGVSLEPKRSDILKELGAAIPEAVINYVRNFNAITRLDKSSDYSSRGKVL